MGEACCQPLPIASLTRCSVLSSPGLQACTLHELLPAGKPLRAVQPCPQLHILALPPHPRCRCPRLARRHRKPCNFCAYDLRCAILPPCHTSLPASQLCSSCPPLLSHANCSVCLLHSLALAPARHPPTTRPPAHPPAHLPAHLPSAAYQIFAQPIFDTVESHVKAFMIKREQKRAGLNGGDAGDAGDVTGKAAPSAASALASIGSASKLAAPGSHHHHAYHPHHPHHPHHQPSPFDTITEEPSGGVQEAASGDMDKAEAGGDGDGCALGPALSTLSSRRMSVRVSGCGMAVHNSCPIPDLVPCKGRSQPQP